MGTHAGLLRSTPPTFSWGFTPTEHDFNLREDRWLVAVNVNEHAEWVHGCGLFCAQIFQGNTNTHIAEMREVDPALIARRIRFVPYSAHTKIVCLRVELYGCVWTGQFAHLYKRQTDRRRESNSVHFRLKWDVWGNILMIFLIIDWPNFVYLLVDPGFLSPPPLNFYIASCFAPLCAALSLRARRPNFKLRSVSKLTAKLSDLELKVWLKTTLNSSWAACVPWIFGAKELMSQNPTRSSSEIFVLPFL